MDSETFLVLSSGVFLTAMVVLMNAQLFGLSLQSIYFGENMKFDWAMLPRYILFLAVVALLSQIYAWLVSGDLSLVLQFMAMNVVIGAVAGINLILHKRT